jgi:circadian clock protein KaiC
MAGVEGPGGVRPRLESGVPGLDEVLEGGLFKSSLYAINGASGTGKTVLASQICFHAVRAGERALYVTLFSELHGNLLANLSSFSFFDACRVSRELQFVSAGRNLADAGPDGVLDMLRAALHQDRPAVLVIDGFRTVEQAACSSHKLIMFVQGLQALATLTGTTGLLLSCSPAGHPGPEQALVEGVLDLENQLQELRAVRTLTVRKFRGGNHLPGQHVFHIDGKGVRVSPRMEARRLTEAPAGLPSQSDRIRFGLPGLDRTLGDGLPAGSTTLVLGPTGAGKTLLGLHLLAEGARLGELSMHFGFFEMPSVLLARARGLSLPLDEAAGAGLVRFVWQPPSEETPDDLADRLLRLLRKRPVRRLVIDGLVGFEQVSLYPARLGRFFSALARELCALGVTTVVTEETRQLFVRDLELPIPGVSAAWQNIIFLRTVEGESGLKRVLVVLKARSAAHDTGLYEFTIGEGGFVMGDRYTAASRRRLATRELMTGRD